MARIGITGHARLAGDTSSLVYKALTTELRRYTGGKLHGITCLCDGVDQIFARAVIERGGDLAVVLPADDYRERLVDRDDFDRLLGKAAQVSRMPFRHSDRQAYKAASEEVLRRCDLLLAVWDGMPSREVGDTADVVATAWKDGVPVVVLWPAGARRA
ncbi:hypothetical protein Psuf_022800 [Phytohabitans suffuscus]|uniref:Uncharacterized protein n=2 Tax=Phytohabitans suffuscus TaxID=624315 RepID=A0A6F8YFX1_9ACTN|nr:hypothetical protein Psuf_022800 [Phytohabitans suffuscus]